MTSTVFWAICVLFRPFLPRWSSFASMVLSNSSLHADLELNDVSLDSLLPLFESRSLSNLEVLYLRGILIQIMEWTTENKLHDVSLQALFPLLDDQCKSLHTLGLSCIVLHSSIQSRQSFLCRRSSIPNSAVQARSLFLFERAPTGP